MYRNRQYLDSMLAELKRRYPSQDFAIERTSPGDGWTRHRLTVRSGHGRRNLGSNMTRAGIIDAIELLLAVDTLTTEEKA